MHHSALSKYCCLVDTHLKKYLGICFIWYFSNYLFHLILSKILNEKCFSQSAIRTKLNLFLTSTVQKEWQIVTFSGSGLQYPYDTWRSINGNCTRFWLFDLHLTSEDFAVYSGPLIRGTHCTVTRNKTPQFNLIQCLVRIFCFLKYLGQISVFSDSICFWTDGVCHVITCS